MTSNIDLHGWAAVPAHVETLLGGQEKITEPTPLEIADIPLPTSSLARSIQAYAKERLPIETYNHSMRVYYLGQAITSQQFPEWKYTPEVYFLCCMLHDIGTTDENISATHMSFEFYGGMLSHKLLLDQDADRDLADAVAEAVIRHQDICTVGSITTVGQVLQLATILDNMGLHHALVHHETIESVMAAFPRLAWSGCFAKTIRKENGLKPWCHTTALGTDAFPNGVLANTLMNSYE